MPTPTDAERELEALAGALRHLESEYTKFFAGRLPKPPLAARAHIDREFRRWDRRQPDSSVSRFRLQSLQSRYATFTELWERAMRAREEGRPAPAAARRTPAASHGRDLFTTVLHDPAHQPKALRELYDAVMDARRRTANDIVPFPRFAELVRTEVERLRRSGASDVAFRVSIAKGQPNLTAKAVRRKG